MNIPKVVGELRASAHFQNFDQLAQESQYLRTIWEWDEETCPPEISWEKVSGKFQHKYSNINISHQKPKYNIS